MGINGKLAGPCGHFVITVYFVISDFVIENFCCILYYIFVKLTPYSIFRFTWFLHACVTISL